MIHSVSVYMMLIGHLRNSAPLLMMLVRDTCLFLYFADTKTKERRQFVERGAEDSTLRGNKKEEKPSKYPKKEQPSGISLSSLSPCRAQGGQRSTLKVYLVPYPPDQGTKQFRKEV